MNNVKLNCADKKIAEHVQDAFQKSGFDATITGTAVITSAEWGRDHEVVAEIMQLFFCLPAFEVTDEDTAELECAS